MDSVVLTTDCPVLLSDSEVVTPLSLLGWSVTSVDRKHYVVTVSIK